MTVARADGRKYSIVRSRLRRAFVVAGLVLAASPPLRLRGASPSRNETPPLRVALSDKVFSGVSVNDARAAMAIWAAEIAMASGLKMLVQANVVLPSEQLLAAIRAGSVDIFALSTEEYRLVAPYVDTERVLVDETGGDEFLLLVREGSGITNLAGLRGRSMMVFESSSTSMAEPWLTVSLWREDLASPTQFFSHTTHSTRLTQVVLPVFFGQADACLVTHRGLKTMFELNPQLEKKLRVLQTSPKLVNALFACRKSYPDQLKKLILDRLVGARANTAARQVLTLFQSPGFEVQSGDCLRSAMTILDDFEQKRQPSGKKTR